MMLRRDMPQAGRGSSEKCSSSGIFHFGWVISFGLLTLVTDHFPDLWFRRSQESYNGTPERANPLSISARLIPRAELFISGDPFISGFPGPIQMLWVSAQSFVWCRPVRIACLLRYPARGNKSKLMDPPNADILELKEMVRDLFRVVQGLALGQKAMAERLERIEGWMIKEKVQGKAPSSEVTNPSGSVVKKSLDSGQPKKKVESGGAQTKRECGKDRYHPYAAAATIPVGGSSVPPRHPSPRPRAQRAGNQVKGKGVDRQFDRPPIPYALLLRKLKDLGMVQLRTLAPLEPDQRPTNYDENAKCEFHSGASGHNLESCRAFKHAVQDLVDSKAINFALMSDVNANPILMHDPMGVNVMSKDKRKIDETNGDQLKAPRPVVPKPRKKEGAFPSVDTCCAVVAAERGVLMGNMTQKMKGVEMDGGRFETPNLVHPQPSPNKKGGHDLKEKMA
ncbi:hypothetical protein KIW84_034080 [Lathyrus oleraceus]|uniref:Uncharacterized protein n=1 Tax=Pisum sativum TaxID=3888 RepID=A0A9D4Y327_PEA|nr:hypothetical protein KIW84_034080 [Pisum sativum]